MLVRHAKKKARKAGIQVAHLYCIREFSFSASHSLVSNYVFFFSHSQKVSEILPRCNLCKATPDCRPQTGLQNKIKKKRSNCLVFSIHEEEISSSLFFFFSSFCFAYPRFQRIEETFFVHPPLFCPSSGFL